MKIIAIVGPTAVGKTDVSLSIAKHFDGEIINMDSVQIYKNLDIGSAKPTREEMGSMPHHLFDFVDPHIDYSVADYKNDLERVLDELSLKGKVPVLVGGTGLYLNSILYAMDFNNAASDPQYRKQLEVLSKEHGTIYLHDMLKTIDPESAERIHPNNILRVIRALEINKLTGKNKKDVQTHLTLNEKYDIILIGLTVNRNKLYARINHRVDTMVEQGLIDEVKTLQSMGLDDTFSSMKGIGYKEVLPYLNGAYGYDVMLSLIKQNSRRYAKRQITWFKKYIDMNWFDADLYSERLVMIDEIINRIDNHQ